MGKLCARVAPLFPEEGQDIEFIEDVAEHLSPEQQERAFSGAWTRPVRKPDAQGIHGTLFYQLDYKKEYYPSKRESDVAGPPHSPAVWLFEPEVGLNDTPGEDPGETRTPLPNWTSRSWAMLSPGSCSAPGFLAGAGSLRTGAGSRLAKPSRSDARRAG